MQKTAIEYLDMTWNPIAMRCTPVSEGCANCWHLRVANRYPNNHALGALDRRAYAGFEPHMKTNELSAPLRRRKPAVIGVQFMGDLFHESITNEQIAAVFGVMAACPQHTFIVLTKRPVEMASWFKWVEQREKDGRKLFPYDDEGWRIRQMFNWCLSRAGVHPPVHHGGPWPLPNVWLGVSVENQKTADERIPTLLQIPAARRFVSIEPMLANVLLDDGCNSWLTCNADDKYRYQNDGECCESHAETGDCFHGIDWVICGAETGPGKRPMEIDWARSVRDQCQAAGVPFFFKRDSDGCRELDGRRWEEMP